VTSVAARTCHRFGAGKSNQGFTLIELIMVIVLLGVLAVAVVPRFADKGDFDAVGYAHRLESVLRFAHKTAIAQRHMVRVDISNAPASADPIITLAGAGVTACTAATITTAVALPTIGQRPKTAVTVTTTPASTSSFCFDPLGRPYAAGGPPMVPMAQLRLDVNNATGDVIRSFYVEASTGYIHE
jgi:prepilin-type N-terminal cleavage/methylation domain-containing protein